MTFPNGYSPSYPDSVSINNNGAPTPRYGTILLSATVDGIAVPGQLRAVYAGPPPSGSYGYGLAAWDIVYPTVPAFWTDFNQTTEWV